ncbi:MAG TPA: DUF6603 domain-containing protein [Aquabacterium sp.]|uniref:DUF6603 domain-containing protein n=1 Tax=Aquabacterium sp. TaxID=1872578 RepID=UPI002E3333D3|nr:DUF6603 domain-containing protein [Aquabacterium sp.]HEX5354827.1 DUF6603 domain-containing protein [Aquabacterium sp.]
MSLSPELIDAAKALGLFNAQGDFDSTWFEHAFDRLQRILSNPTQRDALLSLLDRVVPPAAISGLPAGEKWHPLLGTQTRGNAYVTVKPVSGGVVLGLAGEVHGEAAGGHPGAALKVHVPLMKFGAAAPELVAGLASAPLSLNLRVALGLHRPADPITLSAIRVGLVWAPQAGTDPHLEIVMEGMGLDDGGTRDLKLDPATLGSDAVELVLALVRQQLSGLPAAAVVMHVLGLLGVGDSNVPAFPFAQITQGPAALQSWLGSVLDGGHLTAWLGHFSALFGAVQVPEGAGTLASPTSLLLANLGSVGKLKLALAKGDGRMHVSLGLRLAPAVPAPPARLDAMVTLLAIPLSGMGTTKVLPAARLMVSSPGGTGDLLPAGSALPIQRAQAGVVWDGTTNQLKPVLELLNVTFQGTTHERIDLTHADSVANAANAALQTALRELLGHGQSPFANALLALIGMGQPGSAASWPHQLNLQDLVASPTRALGQFHRAVLTHPTAHWGHLLNELAGLAGLAGGFTGSGTPASPWLITLASAGPLTVSLAAWNHTPGDPTARLRVGLRLNAAAAGWLLNWRADVLGFDLPASGAGQVWLMGGQEASVGLSPLPTANIDGLGLSASSIGLVARWQPGTGLVANARLDGLALTLGPDTHVIGNLVLPPAVPYNLAVPATLPLPMGALQDTLSAFIYAGLRQWSGPAGEVVGGLMGLHRRLPGMPADWPLLFDPAQPQLAFTNPAAALRGYLDRIVQGAGAQGPNLTLLLRWLSGLLAAEVPGGTSELASALPRLKGSGLYDDPWRLSLQHAGITPHAELLLWMDPQGAPASWAGALASAIISTGSGETLLRAAQPLVALVPALADALTGADIARLGSGLDGLVQSLQETDGLVPIGSQQPDPADAPGWSVGATVPLVAHHLQPSHAALIDQALDQIAVWEPVAANRVVLLVHPAFAQASTWSAFKAEAQVRDPGSVVAGTHFNLRQPGVDPLTIALDGVTAVGRVYTADLQDDGVGNHPQLAAQIDRIVTRLSQLRPGARLFIVAHSTAGIAARHFAATQPAKLSGLITIGTPHRGAALTALRDPAVAQALRVVGKWLPSLAAGPTRDALTRLLAALDGWQAAAAPGDLPVPDVFPIGSFAPTDSLATGGVPALALGSRVGGNAFSVIQQGLQSLASGAGAGATLPTHLGVGVQLALGERLDAQAQARVLVRADLARWALRSGVAEPSRPAQSLSARLVLEDPNGGYVLGAPQSHQGLGQAIGDVRLRRAELGLRIVRGPDGQLHPSVQVLAQDAAFHTPTLPRLDAAHPLALPVLGAAVESLFNSVAVGSWMDELGDALQSIGLLAVNAQGRLGLSLDALSAIEADAFGFLKPRLMAAMSSLVGWLGLRADPALGFVLPLGAFKAHARDLGGALGWQVGLQGERHWNTPVNPTGPDLRIGFDVGLKLKTMAPQGQCQATLGAVTLAVDVGNAEVAVAASPWLATPFTVWPAPSATAVQGLLSDLLPRFLLSSGVSLMLRGVLGAQHRIAALDTLVADPAGFFSRAGSFGNGSGGLDGTRLATLLNAIAKALGQAGPNLQLPGGLSLSVSGTTQPQFSLATGSPLGGVLGLNAQLTIDELLHPHPGGSISLSIPAVGSFPGLAIAFGVDAMARVTLAVTPTGGATIQLLPQFSGFGALLAGIGQSLLPSVLDQLNTALGNGGAIKPTALQVAAALNLYDTASGTFVARSQQWGQLLAGGSIGSITGSVRTAFLGAAPGLLNAVVGAAQFSIAPGSNLITWTPPSLATLGLSGGTLQMSLGWDASGPAFAIGATALQFSASAPVVLSFSGGFAMGAPAMTIAAGVKLLTLTGIDATPGLRVALGASGLDVRVRPFDVDAAAPLEINLLKAPHLITTSDLASNLATDWLLPLVTQVLVRATKPQQSVHLWASGPTIGTILQSAGLTDGSGNPKMALPDLPVLISGILQGLLSGLSIKVDDKLTIGFSPTAGKLGVRLSGHLPIEVGDYKLTIYAGEMPGGKVRPAPDNGGLVFDIFKLAPFTFQPELKVLGLGVGFADKNDKPLVDSVVRLGEVAAFVFFNARLHSGFQTSGWGFEADIARFGLPLSQGMSGGGSGGGGNPVASSLLSSDGGSGGGDKQAVSPETDVLVGYRDGKGFYLDFGGQSGALWITVQKKFGPIYIEQIGVKKFEGDKKIGLLLDGGVKVSSLAVQVDDLTLLIPITKLGDASQWGLDLAGMAVALEAGPVKLSGGLLKNFGPPVSYDGALMVDVCGRGFTAIGSYARPSDELGEYVSFFVFVSLPIPLGGPPYFFVLGLGGGVGLNRALIPPSDLNLLPSFPLVAAIDNSAFANDPMSALRDMGTSIPPRRGSFWLAAGLKFSTFALVNSTAVLYVALDRGLEIGLLGLSRMSLPSADFAIAQIELALKARFSTEEGLLSVQAQLTDRSYLFHPSCQLTGGFAFFLWFRTGRFVLTLGGYHKAFNKPADFPVVPRLGFRWSVSDAIVIKGENYFALTTTAVMAGGRLEASFHGGPVKAWFKTWLDVLVAWDPFYYMFDAGIEIGASVDTGIFGEVGVSLGASVHIEGPPLQGYVEVEILIVTVHIDFGDKAHKINYIEDFNVFKAKYLTSDDTRSAVDVQLRAGLLPTDPPGAEPAPGTLEAPWRIGVEFAFESESTIAANRFRWQDGIVKSPAGLSGPISLAPMNPQSYADVTSIHELRIVKVVGNAIQTITLDSDRFIIEPVAGHFPEATWHWVDPRHVKAAANNIDRLQGLKVQGVAEFVRRSAVIQISKAVDDLPDHYALPLPFRHPEDFLFLEMIPIGVAANKLLDLTVGWDPVRRNKAVQQLLSQPEMAQARQGVGLSGQGLSALAQRQLRTRSAPARVVPLSAGLTLAEPAQAAPVLFEAKRNMAEHLRVPRLLTVMRRRVAPTSDAPAALRTTVFKVEQAKTAPRMNAPHARPSMVGARLHRAAHPQVAAPTRMAQGARTLHHPAIASAGQRHAEAFEQASKQIMGEGLVIPAGTTQLWELPETEQGAHVRVSLQLSGVGAVRVVWLDRRGRVIADQEMATLRGAALSMPEGAARVAVSALGRASGLLAQRLPKQGDVTLMLAPAGHTPAVGWQTGMLLEQVGAHTLLGRGASLHTAQVVTAPLKTLSSTGLIAAERAVADQTAVTTRLPSTVTVVAFLLEQVDATAAFDGDLAVTAEGAVMSLPPVAVIGGTRRTVLYDVRATQEAQAQGWFEISVASEKGWRLGGVIGLQGKADDWADRLDGDAPPTFIDDRALSADGDVRARFAIAPDTSIPQTRILS